MNVELKEVHIGQAISEKFEKTKMNKSEFGRRIGVPQQHVNRLFERETIETGKLVKICKALDFNFFSLYCRLVPNVTANLSAVALGDGEALNNVGDSGLLAQITELKGQLETAHSQKELKDELIATLRDQIEGLKSHLKDKDALIEILRNQNQN